MGNENAILECLARYSSSNLALMVFDNLDDAEKLPRAIWRIAARPVYLSAIAGDDNLAEVLRAAQQAHYDGILYRLIENLSPEKQNVLSRTITKMSGEHRGKFIFTTNDFNLFDREFLKLVCRISFWVDIKDEPVPAEAGDGGSAEMTGCKNSAVCGKQSV